MSTLEAQSYAHTGLTCHQYRAWALCVCGCLYGVQRSDISSHSENTPHCRIPACFGRGSLCPQAFHASVLITTNHFPGTEVHSDTRLNKILTNKRVVTFRYYLSLLMPMHFLMHGFLPFPDFYQSFLRGCLLREIRCKIIDTQSNWSLVY